MNAMSLAASECHARLVAEDAAAGKLAAGIDGEHGDLLFRVVDQIRAERLNHAALARTGNAGDADADGVAAVQEGNLRRCCSASSRSCRASSQ